jgi:hypothetical protein
MIHVDQRSHLSNLPEQPEYRDSPTHAVIRHHDERRGKRETGECGPSMVRFGDPDSVSGTDKLTPDSIQDALQDALRMYFQPIKTNDPKLDFYTIYKRETMEYDTEYMQKYNEDLNTTLIFVRFPLPFTATQY